jgi:hypothetical protein
VFVTLIFTFPTHSLLIIIMKYIATKHFLFGKKAGETFYPGLTVFLRFEKCTLTPKQQGSFTIKRKSEWKKSSKKSFSSHDNSIYSPKLQTNFSSRKYIVCIHVH